VNPKPALHVAAMLLLDDFMEGDFAAGDFVRESERELLKGLTPQRIHTSL
jgi:hypothetical protein